MVFIEFWPTMPVFKIARTLKKKKNYETVLISFSKIDNEFFSKAFDKIIIFETGDPRMPKNWIFLLKQIFSSKRRKFFDSLKELHPYIVQTTGIDILPMLANTQLFKKYPRVYFAYDIWEFYGKKLSFKKYSGRMNYFNKFYEKICMKSSDGILHKGPEGELNWLTYGKKLKVPEISFLIYCLDEWLIPPKKKFNKEPHVVYVGGYFKYWEGHTPFREVVDEIISQKIHFHVYSTNKNKEDEDKELLELERKNKYFHLHSWINADILSKEISNYDFGIIADFIDENSVGPLHFKTVSANKILSYIESGLPVIINKQFEFMCSILEEDGIGIKIGRGDLKNLNPLIKKIDANKMLKNIKKAQKRLSLSKNIKKYEDFYGRVHNSKN